MPEMSIPSTVKLDQRLQPSTQGMERISTPAKLMSTALFRLICQRSMVKEMIFSKTAITVDRAAKDRNRKKAPPHSRPMGMWLKMLGRVMNTSGGPFSVATP